MVYMIENNTLEIDMKKQILEYVKKRGFTDPTNTEIKRSIPPGRQQDARNGKVWIGRCPVYGSKMWYSVKDIESFIKRGI
jgi:hypothetical protein